MSEWITDARILASIGAMRGVLTTLIESGKLDRAELVAALGRERAARMSEAFSGDAQAAQKSAADFLWLVRQEFLDDKWKSRLAGAKPQGSA